MADADIQLRGLVFNAAELREISGWPPALVEDYLNLIENLVQLAEAVNRHIEEIGTEFEDNSILVVSDGFLIEDSRLTFDLITGVLSATPTLAELYQEGMNVKTADSITLTAGTLISGTVDDTKSIDQVYYQVQELSATPGFDIRFNLTLDNNPGKWLVVCRYEGNPAHNVLAEAWNYTGSTWDRFTAATRDFPSGAVDVEYSFDFNDLAGAITDYVSGTDAIVRMYHSSAGNTSHDMYIDYLAIQEQQIVITAPGTFITMTDFNLGEVSNVTVDEATGEMTIIKPGYYSVNMMVSFLGTDSTAFEGHLFKNDVKVDKIGAERTLGSTGDIGTTGFTGIMNLVQGDVLTIGFTADSVGYASIENINWNITRLN